MNDFDYDEMGPILIEIDLCWLTLPYQMFVLCPSILMQCNGCEFLIIIAYAHLNHWYKAMLVHHWNFYKTYFSIVILVVIKKNR